MTKEEIVKELDELGNVLYNKFGGDSFLERCTIHDLKAKIKALIITDVVVNQRELLFRFANDWNNEGRHSEHILESDINKFIEKEPK